MAGRAVLLALALATAAAAAAAAAGTDAAAAETAAPKRQRVLQQCVAGPTALSPQLCLELDLVAGCNVHVLATTQPMALVVVNRTMSATAFKKAFVKNTDLNCASLSLCRGCLGFTEVEMKTSPVPLFKACPKVQAQCSNAPVELPSYDSSFPCFTDTGPFARCMNACPGDGTCSGRGTCVKGLCDCPADFHGDECELAGPAPAPSQAPPSSSSSSSSPPPVRAGSSSVADAGGRDAGGAVIVVLVVVCLSALCLGAAALAFRRFHGSSRAGAAAGGGPQFSRLDLQTEEYEEAEDHHGDDGDAGVSTFSGGGGGSDDDILA